MKQFKKFSLIIFYFYSIFIITVVGCTAPVNEESCGGIVDNVVVTDLSEAYGEKHKGVEVTITISENSDKEDFYYTALFISQTAMTKYNCKTLDEIVLNQAYIDDIADYKAQQSSVKSGTTSFTFTNRNHDCLYIIIFESSGDFNDTLIPVTDPSAYIGWIKF